MIIIAGTNSTAFFFHFRGKFAYVYMFLLPQFCFCCVHKSFLETIWLYFFLTFCFSPYTGKLFFRTSNIILILWLGADLLNNYFFHLQLGAGVGIRISMFLCTLIILFRLSADSLTVWHLYCHH